MTSLEILLTISLLDERQVMRVKKIITTEEVLPTSAIPNIWGTLRRTCRLIIALINKFLTILACNMGSHHEQWEKKGLEA